MRALTIVGIILVVLGIAGFVIQGITVTSTEEVADIGPLEIQEEHCHWCADSMHLQIQFGSKEPAMGC